VNAKQLKLLLFQLSLKVAHFKTHNVTGDLPLVSV
jgi:hypothetical protein